MRRFAGLVVFTALLALAGCADPPSSPPSSPQPSAATSGASTEATPTTTGTGTTPPPANPGPTYPEPANPAALVSFIQDGNPVNPADYDFNGLALLTPSGNIKCSVAPGQVLCLITDNSGWPVMLPQTCQGTWIDKAIVTIATGTRRGLCTITQNPIPVPGTVLPYGSTLSNGSGFACRSESQFLACAHLASGNGFIIAREVYRVYGTILELPPEA